MDSLQLGACSYGSIGAQGGTSGHGQPGVMSRRYSEQGVAKVQGTCRIVPTPELERVGRHFPAGISPTVFRWFPSLLYLGETSLQGQV